MLDVGGRPVEDDGRFVAEKPGLYTIVATCGNVTDWMMIRANERFAQKQKLVKVGHGPVLDVHTSDLWVWEGADGRDYCVTGTWGANGVAIFWDVTDPSRIERIATVTVDARTVNDVKVSEDGRLCIISREGASNRKNGIVAFDVTDPRKPTRISEFADQRSIRLSSPARSVSGIRRTSRLPASSRSVTARSSTS